MYSARLLVGLLCLQVAIVKRLKDIWQWKTKSKVKQETRARATERTEKEGFLMYSSAHLLCFSVQKGKTGVRTTCVCPYFIDTGMFEGAATRYAGGQFGE